MKIRSPLGLLLGLMSFGVSTIAIAQPVAAQPASIFRSTLPRLQQETNIPILLPSELPSGLGRISVEMRGDGIEGYIILLRRSANCHSENSCYVGSFSADQQWGHGIPAGWGDGSLALTRGIRGYYHIPQGSASIASLEWLYNEVLYGIGLRSSGNWEQDRNALVAMANSAIENYLQTNTFTNRSQPARQTLLLHELGALNDQELVLPSDRSRYEIHNFDGQAGQVITITMESNEFDAYLLLLDADGNTIAQNDDMSQNNLNAQLVLRLPYTGRYQIVANAYDLGGQGSYVLTVR